VPADPQSEWNFSTKSIASAWHPGYDENMDTRLYEAYRPSPDVTGWTMTFQLGIMAKVAAVLCRREGEVYYLFIGRGFYLSVSWGHTSRSVAVTGLNPPLAGRDELG
jgi:hypothetical protein